MEDNVKHLREEGGSIFGREGGDGLTSNILKGTVSVISSDPPCKDGNARFTTIPLKALSD